MSVKAAHVHSRDPAPLTFDSCSSLAEDAVQFVP